VSERGKSKKDRVRSGKKVGSRRKEGKAPRQTITNLPRRRPSYRAQGGEKLGGGKEQELRRQFMGGIIETKLQKRKGRLSEGRSML